ncbi:hypothetical protein [Angustibacter sp. Root456]|uniref:hypothetical protein n=1 Tax=Angustibacter sp. Root456 TaxID=1736539 RepID=UPI0006F9AEDB|nr:hypothetical protein [Angustibacter sp. Root456]KQX64565.1 hypothetical protein ASD06_10480 [Angustibacter sp. Root456]
MTYSLVNASALGFDLVRLPGGPNVAEVVVRAIDADAAALQELANAHPGPCRTACWDAAVRAAAERPPMRAALELAADAIDLAAAGDQRGSQELVTRLGAAPLGDLQALDRFVRREVLDWTWETAGDIALQRLRDRLAADVLVDAATSAYCAQLLGDDDRRHLAAPYVSASRDAVGAGAAHAGDAADAADAGDAVVAVLHEITSWDESDRAEWRSAVDLLRTGQGAWTSAMHDAGWAAHLAGRTRTAARVQMLAVTAFRTAGFNATDAARGSWNALSGVLQALLVIDLLGDDETGTLLAPWHLARGGRPGSGRRPGDR